ncbi:MAG TPA: DUF4129 domain-containing protein [Gaiellaceae bacterium]
MEPLPRSGRGTRLAALGLGLLVLLSIVAFASRTGVARHSEVAPSQGYVDYAVTVFLILFILMIPVAIYAFLLRLRERATTGTAKSLKARLYAGGRWLAIVLIVFIVFLWRSRHPDLFQHIDPFRQAHTKIPHGHDQTQPVTNPRFQWNVLWVALVLLTGIAAYGTYRWKTRPPLPGLREIDLSVSEELAASISWAIDDLEAEPDARRAVIAAYARMEAVLGRNGFERAPSETAIEYLRRILLGLTTRGAAVTQLTALFERAKFSRDEIDGSMKQEAIAALREIRDDLAK